MRDLSQEDLIRDAFLDQVVACENLGSPFTACLCRLFAARLEADGSVGVRVLTWPGDPDGRGSALPLRLAGALHALVISAADPGLMRVYPPASPSDDELWDGVATAMRTHAAFILDRLLSAPQTNEVRRTAALVPGFLTISKLFGLPLTLSEVGASAGLNMHWDRYAFRFGGLSSGDRSAPVQIAPEWRGPEPPADEATVIERAGCDINPLDPASPADVERLLSYIWADQTDRLERTSHALHIAAAAGTKVEKADAIDWLATRLSAPKEGSTHVIYHSIAWQYLPDDGKQAGEDLILDAGARATATAPLARLQMEADGQKHSAAITLQIWPSGERHVLGRADFHGRWVEWFGWPSIG